MNHEAIVNKNIPVNKLRVTHIITNMGAILPDKLGVQ